ncbi:MAG: DEAD/DEAH box helicase [Candidatus Schekmanbacteria bacterium]|nr:DEAD/DEAH box helicase [Candidatus Schekmanbacteria bacterium]
MDDEGLLKELGLDNIEVESFKELGLEEPLLKALKKQKFEKPTPIQEKAIPLALAGKDLIAGSSTGSGKTLAFGAGIIQNSVKGQGVQALILTPTRELAEQVAAHLKVFSAHKPLKITAIYGGVPINQQIVQLKDTDIVVGTPGRILDHVGRRTVKFDQVKTLVLDEADTMLDMGFIQDVEEIIGTCPADRQTLLFSATLTKAVTSLAARHTKKAVNVLTKTAVDPQKLIQTYYQVSKSMKFPLLAHLLKQEEDGLAMVFCNSRRITDLVARNVNNMGIKANAIHGGFPQKQRSDAISRFNSKKIRVLVCTDVAARGLDIAGVSHVYNYDIPADSKQYIHRVGRTARAGKEGKAISILSANDHEQFSKIIKDNSTKIARLQLPEIEGCC